MAKSLRSKSKRTFRRMKREDSAFAVAHATRLQRLSAKLKGSTQTEPATSAPEVDETSDAVDADIPTEHTEESGMELDATPVSSKISTSGPRATRRGQRKFNQKARDASRKSIRHR